MTALMITAKNYYMEMAEMLVKAGADVNQRCSDNVSALLPVPLNECFAERNAPLKLSQTLQFGWTALMFASNEGHALMVESLLQWGANVNQWNDVSIAVTEQLRCVGMHIQCDSSVHNAFRREPLLC
jgi:ankyrin repeat protein